MTTVQTVLPIRGMICRACTDSVAEALTQTRGVTAVRVRYFKRCAEIEYDPDLVTPEALCRRVEQAGYETGEKRPADYLTDAIGLLLTVGLVWFLTASPLNPVPTATAETGLGYLFLIGLLTSPHCVGMCGGILLGSVTKDAPRATLRAGAEYQLGRVAAYTAMGAIFGALGTVLTYTMREKSMVFTLVGLAVALLGLHMWGLLPGLRGLFPEQRSACSLPGAARRRVGSSPLLIGLLTGLMPCGALYAMWLLSMSSGSAGQGALKMLAFALGTVPLLFAFSTFGAWLPRRWNKYLRKLGSILITAMGAKMLLMGLSML